MNASECSALLASLAVSNNSGNGSELIMAGIEGSNSTGSNDDTLLELCANQTGLGKLGISLKR